MNHIVDIGASVLKDLFIHKTKVVPFCLPHGVYVKFLYMYVMFLCRPPVTALR